MTLNSKKTFGRRKLEGMGDRLGSIKRLSKYDTRVFSFSYRSRGANPKKPKPNKDPQPLLLVAYKDEKKSFKLDRKTYMYGFNLNYLPELLRLKVLERIRDDYGDWDGRPVDYSTLKSTLRLSVSSEDSIFRKYRTGGGNLSRLVAINLDTYIEELRLNISRNRP